MKRLNLVIATDEKGKLSCLHIGESFVDARVVIDKALADGKLAEVALVRNPSGKVFRPKAAKAAADKAKAEAVPKKQAGKAKK